MKENKNKVEAETKVDPKITALTEDLGKATIAMSKAVVSAGSIAELPEPIFKRIQKLRDGLLKSLGHVQKQINGLGKKAERLAAKELRVATAATKKEEKLEKLFKQQKALATRITKLQEAE